MEKDEVIRHIKKFAVLALERLFPNIQTRVWLSLLCFLTFSAILYSGMWRHYVENRDLIQNIFISDSKFVYYLFLITFFTFLWFVVDPIKKFRVQFKRNTPSWTWYALWLTLLIPTMWGVAGYITPTTAMVGVVSILLLVAFLPPSSDKPKRFSYGAIGIEEDKLNFKTHVNGFVKTLESLHDCVSIVSVFGDFGRGKSSFVKMAIQKMNAEELLYTYISLTEANEAKDFGKLFSERWSETLSERYPMMDITSSIDMLKLITRETSASWSAIIPDLVSKLNKPIVEWGNLVGQNNQLSSSKIDPALGKMFGYVNSFSETRWVVVIDEIERSSRAEIYRVIEIIERFKSLSMAGLPLKLIFIICTSESDLTTLLSENHGEPSKQIRDFFFSDSKLLTHVEFVPYPSWDNAIKFTQSKILEIRNDKTLHILYDLHETESTKLDAPQESIARINLDRRFPNSTEVLDVITLLMADESPRFTSKVTSDLEFVTRKLSSRPSLKESLREKLPLSFAHLLLMSYIRIKYPDLYIYIQLSIDDIVRVTEDKITDNMYLSFTDKKEKYPFVDHYKKIRDKDIQLHDAEIQEKLIRMLSKEYGNFYSGKSEDPLEDYISTGFDPLGLIRYLKGIEGVRLPEDAEFVSLYHRWETERNLSRILPTSTDLYNFAKNLRRLYSLKSELHLEVAKEIFRRFKNRSIEITPATFRGTSVAHHLAYEFLFHISFAVKKTKLGGKLLNSFMKEVGRILTQFFASNFITVEAKLTLLNSLVGENRDSDMHFDLDDLVKKTSGKGAFSIKKAAKATIAQFRSKYLKGNVSIYDCEENYYYVLNQIWSGDKSDIKGINEIQQVALKNLEKYPNVLADYWDMIPYESKDTDLDSLFGRDFTFHVTSSLFPYLTLSSLIRKSLASKLDKNLMEKVLYWKRQGRKGISKYESVKPPQDAKTLMRTLIANKII